ncbi:MAG: hypothetical protein E7242_01080 [Lachnospiraceae bacterium]|nr:hypothetical protein [Lachnospiraceae bacterium]
MKKDNLNEQKDNMKEKSTLRQKLDKIDEFFFKKHFKLTSVIIAAMFAAVIIVLAYGKYVNNNILEEEKVQGIIDARVPQEEGDRTSKQIVHGTIEDTETGQKITTKDGRVYLIENGAFYQLEADGSKTKLTNDLSLVTVYDDKGDKNTVVDGRLVAEVKAEEETTTPAAVPAEQTVGEAVVAPEEQQVDIGEDVGVTQPPQTDLPWIYPYPTQTGYYKNDEVGWAKNVPHGNNVGFTAEQIARMDELAWAVATNAIDEDEFDAQVAALFGKGELAPGLWDVQTSIWRPVKLTVTEVQEKIATQGYYYDYGYNEEQPGYVKAIVYYDAGTDTAYLTLVSDWGE